jgi:hypothetical protein
MKYFFILLLITLTFSCGGSSEKDIEKDKLEMEAKIKGEDLLIRFCVRAELDNRKDIKIEDVKTYYYKLQSKNPIDSYKCISEKYDLVFN